MNEKTVSEGASLPRSSAKVLRRVLSAAAVLFALCLVLAAPAVAEGGPDMTGNTILVNASNAQDVLDGKYGSIAGKTIHFTENIPDVLELARPTKYEGSGTVYYNYVNYQLETEPTPWSENISTTMNSHSHYYRTLQNVTFTAANDVTVAGFNFSAGHVASSGYDYVRDVEQTEGVTYYKYSSLDNITFKDLTITGQFDASLYLEDSSVQDITFDGCTFTGTTDDGSNAAIKFLADNQYFENIVVKDCNIDGYYQGVYISGVNGAEIIDNVINNTGHNAIALQSESNPAKGTINVKENFLNNIGDRAIRFNYVSADAVITINNNIMVNAGNSGDQLIKAEGSSSNSVNLENNYWNGIALTTAVQTFYVPTAVGVSGGTWDTDVSAYVAEGYQCVEEGGSYIVREADPVAQIGETGYTSLQKAVDAAEENAEIVLITDVTDVTLAVPADKKITLELNGKTITGVYDNQNKGSFVIKNQGHLTINDSIGTGAIVSNVQYPDATYGYGNNAIDNFGTLVVNSGTIKVITDGAGSLVAIDSREGASLIVNGGNISSKKNAIRLAPFTSNEVLITSAVINGGSITGNRGIQIHLPSSTASVAQQVTLEINDGIISSSSTSDSRLAIYSYSYGNGIDNVTITIRNGTINGDVAFTGGSNKNPAENVTVTGGIFNGFDGAFYSYADDEVAKETMSVTGGWFNNKTYVEYYLADGYACVEENGGYAVKKAHKITWMHPNGTELMNETLPVGTLPAYTGATPVNATTQEYTYTFEGWTPEIEEVTAAATYTAVFTEIKNQYNITWQYENGTLISKTQVEYGTTPVYTGVTPVNASTAQFNYEFAGWTPTLVSVTGDAVYNATFTEKTRNYTVTWMNDTVVLQTIEVQYGTVPALYDGEKPVKESDAQYTYDHTGWTNADGQLFANDVNTVFPEVTGPQTYYANFTESLRNYTVVWKNADGTVLETDTNVDYDVMPTYNGATPEKTSTEQYSYEHNGWTPAVTNVTGDAEYTATFTEKIRNYTVTWLNADGTELEIDENVPYGTVPSFNAAEPTKAGNNQYSYTFTGWDKDNTTGITGDVTFTATYAEMVNKYLITWVNDTATLKTEEVAYGEPPVFGEDNPTKEDTDEYSYEFVGWEPDIVPVAGEATYKANFTATLKQYQITWVNETGAELKNETLDYGAVPSYGEAPIKESDAQYTYEFAGWLNESDVLITEFPAVTGDATYTANFTAAVRNYGITWNITGEKTTVDVPYGDEPKYTGNTPTQASTAQYDYTFAGWTNAAGTLFTENLPAVTEAEEYTANFTAVLRNYTITWNIEGTKSTQQIDYGMVPVYNGALPTKSDETGKYTYTFAGWNPGVQMVTGDATYTAQFTAEEIKVENVTPAIKPTEIIQKDEDTGAVTIVVPTVPSTGGPQASQETTVTTHENTTTIVDKKSGVTMELTFDTKAEATTDKTGNTSVTGTVEAIKVTYPVKEAEVDDHIEAATPEEKPVTQTVEIQFNESKIEALTTLPVISSEVKKEVKDKVENKAGSHKVVAMITATSASGKISDINDNIKEDGIVVKFVISKKIVNEVGQKNLRIYHVSGDSIIAYPVYENENKAPKDAAVVATGKSIGHDDFEITIKASHFSSYVVGYEEEQEYNDYYDDEDDTPATPVTPEKPEDKPTETPSDEPSDDPTDVPGDAPSEIPGTTPSEPGKSPAPILGVLAALGAAVVLRRK